MIRILEASHYHVEQEVFSQADGIRFAIDAVIRDDDNTQYLADIKWTRRDPIPLQMLRDWAARVSTYKTINSSAHLILIVSGRTDSSHRTWIRAQFNVDIWDRDFIESLSHAEPALASDFKILQSETARMEHERALKLAPESSASRDFAIAEREESSPATAIGATLTARLRAIQPGRKGARQYESVCIDIIDYLFGEHLVDARSQARTEDGLNVFDVVYRVKQAHSFWNTLTRDFRARVVMFEFKNYSGKIGPHQVYSTERYMSGSAMRRICFIVSRQAPHAHAELAAVGALRENGNLLVFLHDDDLETMLQFRDREVVRSDTEQIFEDDPSVLLDQKIYQFLATVGR